MPILVILSEEKTFNSVLGGNLMVNENFDRFKKEQQKHKSTYLGSEADANRPGSSNPNYNGRGNTDKNVGATGRNIE